MKIAMHNPHTGGTGEVEVDRLQEAIADGLVPQSDVEMFNPATEGAGVVPAANLAAALQDGLLPVGSRKHRIATTGKLESAARGAAQGFTFNLADEAQAGIRSIFSDKTYQQLRDEYREGDEIAREANPKTFMGSEIGAGVASSFIPGLGAVGAIQKGAKLGQVLKAGATMGALSGFGASDADLTKGDIGGAAKDTGMGALLGAGGNAAFMGVGKAVSGAGRFVKEGLEEAFDPVRNRVAALGGKSKEFTDLVSKGAKGAYNKGEEATNVLAKNGVFKGNPKGDELLSRLGKEMDDAVTLMHEAMADVGGVNVGDARAIFYGSIGDLQPLNHQMDRLLKEARPDELPMLKTAVADLVARVDDTGGDLGKIWDLKKLLGQYAGAAYKKAPEEVTAAERAWMLANEHLDEIVTQVTDRIAKQTGKTSLSEANEKFAAAATWFKPLAKKLGAEGWQANVGGMRYRDWFAGSATTGVLMGLGVPAEVAMPLGVAGSAVNSVIRSTPGRLARAKMGEQMKVMANAAAQQAGKLPRTTPAIQKLTGQYIGMVQQMLPPDVASRLQQFATTQNPKEAGEMLKSLMADSTVRGLVLSLPGLKEMLAPSKYQSEFDGHVFAPEDKAMAAKQYTKMGFDPVTEAQKVSELNRTGRLDPALFAPPPPDYGDVVADFNSRLTELGY
jgi:hypothetical protein